VSRSRVDRTEECLRSRGGRGKRPAALQSPNPLGDDGTRLQTYCGSLRKTTRVLVRGTLQRKFQTSGSPLSNPPILPSPLSASPFTENIIADTIQHHGGYTSQTQRPKLLPPSSPLRPRLLYEAARAAGPLSTDPRATRVWGGRTAYHFCS